MPGKRAKMRRNYFLINLVFFIVIVLLGFKVYGIWTKPLDIQSLPDGSQVQEQEQQKAQPDAKKAADEGKQEKGVNEVSYEIIVQKDLFRPSRTPFQAKEDAPEQIFLASPPRLFGTVIMDGTRSAILEDPVTKITRLYRLNDIFAGYTISDIQEDEVVLSKDGRKIDVKLRAAKTVEVPRQRPVTPPQTPTPQISPQIQPPGAQKPPPPPRAVQVPTRRVVAPPPPPVEEPPHGVENVFPPSEQEDVEMKGDMNSQ